MEKPPTALSAQIVASLGEKQVSFTIKRHLAPLTVGSLLRAFPFKGNVNRLGENIVYVQSPATAGLERPRTEFAAGDVAFMPSQGAVCFVLSNVQTGRPMTPIGKITENLEALSGTKPGQVASLRMAE